ncbi:NB-ARC domain-containing protein [Reticulomyxa filosa]|uniref:NB-ARC domain-containing protein n=1 Tax=Reticulomyxa filosa TaxID=46433 RepID=X6NSS4_RETFI|nr:NB-ARC domain-containing protein [Reticulomyxa filosa]|eukprot:ETO29051.1 NB-ARC domain-containing protein [Reticulomyxa filosa]
MQHESNQGKYAREIKVLKRLCGDAVDEETLKKQFEENNGNVALVIESILSKVMHQKFTVLCLTKKKDNNQKLNTMRFIICYIEIRVNIPICVHNCKILQKKKKIKKDEKTEVGEIKSGINLQGFCENIDCLAAKAKFPVWVNIGFGDISFVSDKTSYCCPDCKQPTVASIIKAMLFNSEHRIYADDNSPPVMDNYYQAFYTIKHGLTYTMHATKIRQHATNLQDLITRSERAMESEEVKKLVEELQKHLITVVKPEKVKDQTRLLEKIRDECQGDHNQVFDIGRFTILCDDAIKLQTAVAVVKKAEQFRMVVSEDKDYFEKQSPTHYRFHKLKLYVPKHDVYVEMQATLKSYTTLKGYTIIENPELSHLYYELVRAWKPQNSEEEELKQASYETLTKISDITCEWIDGKGIQKIADRYRSHSDIVVLKPPQLSKKSEIEIKNNASLKIAQFMYEQLCKFTPEKIKGKALYAILYEYYKKYIIGDKNPASCADFALLLQESRKQEMEEDVTILHDLETYIPLQANNYPHTDGDDRQKHDTFDCHQHILEILGIEEEEEKKSEQQQKKITIIQGESGSGKSIFCRHLEETLWHNYILDSKQPIPVYISFAKSYNKQNEKDLILQALQARNINKEIMDVIREKVSFVFIMDGFDEIFDKYNKSDNEQYFYHRFNLDQWNAKIIVTCRSNVLNEDDIKNALIINQNNTSMMYLWPFTKQQMHSYIEKFAKMQSKNNNNNNWTPQQYEETLNNYPNLLKMVEEPFLLRLILTVMPSLIKQYGAGSKISKAQVYDVFNEQWIDTRAQHIMSKLAELRIQTNFNKLKSTLKQYCLDLSFELLIQGSQVAIESTYLPENDEIINIEDPKMENESKNNFNEKKMNTSDNSNVKIQDIWKKYFNGDSIAKYVLRRGGNNKYQFLHKSCQEYYAAQKIISEILSWKPNVATIDNQQFQQQFQQHIHNLSINCKLLNKELGIIHFVAERIYDTNSLFINLKSRLFRIIEASKKNERISIAAANAATILNSANINMHNRNWNNINIPNAILDYAFLEGTTFNNANLNNVSFVQACLNKTNFTNASMNDAYFGEYAYLSGHSDRICAVQFSPDGKKIVSCSDDDTIKMWDALSGKKIQTFEGHSSAVKIIQFSPDGSKILSSSRDNTIRIWNASSGRQIHVWKEHTNVISVAQFSPDGFKVVSSSWDNTVQIWDVSSGKRIHLLDGHSSCVNGAQFSPDSSRVASSSWDRTIRIWDVLSGKQIQILEGHTDYVNGTQFTLDGSKIISHSKDKTIRVWDLSSGKQLQILKGHSTFINGIQLSSDGSKILSFSYDKTCRIWDLLSGKLLQVLEGHTDRVELARFSFDDSRVVTCSWDKTLRVWDVSSGKQIQVLEGHSGIVRGMEYFPKSFKVLSYSDDKTIRIWDTTSERKIQLTERNLDDVIDVRFSLDGSTIISSSVDKAIQLWDVKSGRNIQIFDNLSSDGGAIQISPDASKVVSYSSDDTIRIWDLLSGKQLQLFEGYAKEVSGVQFSSDSNKIGLFSKDETIQIYDLSSKKQIQLLSGCSQTKEIQFSPDNSKIVSCSFDHKIRVWDLLSGNILQVFEGHPLATNGILFSPNGSTIVSYSWDKTIRSWDIASGKQHLLLKEHSDNVTEVQFSPDGTKLVSGSDDKTVRLWDFSSGKQLHVLKGIRVV